MLNICALLLVLTAQVGLAQQVSDTPEELKNIGVDEALGKKVPLDLTFTNEVGKKVQLGDYFKDGKPVILNMAYYECPMLCTLILNGVRDSIRGLKWTAGHEYTVLTVSIDPDEGHELAAQKRENYSKDLYGNQNNLRQGDWHFLVGSADQSQALAKALGYKYYYNYDTQEWAHSAATFILSGDGKITRYLYGLTYSPKDMRLALVEASQGKIGSTVDRVLLYCYQYDPNSKGYVLVARNVMKLGGGLTVMFLAIVLGGLWRRERKKSNSENLKSTGTGRV